MKKNALAQLAYLAQFEGKCAKSVKNAMQKFDKTKINRAGGYKKDGK